jgi:signal transduction histidine kinase
MAKPTPDYAEYDASKRDWHSGDTRLGRFSARFGLQGKLVLCFMGLLSAALGASCVIFLSQTKDCVEDIIAEQAQQLASTLAWSCEDSLTRTDHGERDLASFAGNLIKGRNILLVAFYDQDGRAVAQRSRDPDFEARAPLSSSVLAAQQLSRAQPRKSKLFGDYMEVVAPVLHSPRDARGNRGPASGARLLGYVKVGVSGQYEASQMGRINMMVVGAGCVAAMLGLPMAYLMVRRIFLPIRQLLAAARRIIAGDLEARVAIHRKDVIGDLARSFNEMVNWVKKQQSDVAAVNAQLAEANRDLESKIEQRTAQMEIANKRLSQEIAEKEDFLRAISHDLNAPLRNISGMATMLLMKNKEKFDEDVIHRLERIKSNVDVETDLINELLELSRIKTRRQKMEPVDMEQLIWELRGLFENDLKSRGIELRIETQLPVINCERARMRQIFQNLIDNAIKYMGEKPERGIHVGCTLRLDEAEFYVRDTGMGIEADEVDKVFFVFRRGKNTAAQNIAGKGVGLASVKSIVETYNGRIWVESRLGEGSTFKFVGTVTCVGIYDGYRAKIGGDRHQIQRSERPKSSGPSATCCLWRSR